MIRLSEKISDPFCGKLSLKGVYKENEMSRERAIVEDLSLFIVVFFSLYLCVL